MLEAKEIAEISYELIRQLSDRIHMAWEDDRAHLLRDIYKLQASSRREKVAQKHLKRQISTLASRMEEHFPAHVHGNEEADDVRSTESSIFDSETQQHPPSLLGSGSSDEKTRIESKKRKAGGSPNRHKSDSSSSRSSSGESRSSSGHAVLRQDNPRVPSRRNTVSGKALSPVSPVRNTCGHSSAAALDGFKYSETARGKVAREGLKGYACPECEGYYRALEQQGVHVSREAPSLPTTVRTRKTGSIRAGSRERADETHNSSTKSRSGRGIKRSLTEGNATAHVRGGLESVYGQSYAADESRDMVQLHSRHRNKSTPPSTPEGFWDLTILTPDDWKQNENKKN